MRELFLSEVDVVDGGSLANDAGKAVGGAIADAVNKIESAWNFVTSPPQTWAWKLAYS